MTPGNLHYEEVPDVMSVRGKSAWNEYVIHLYLSFTASGKCLENPGYRVTR
jgi:hypothetical protein